MAEFQTFWSLEICPSNTSKCLPDNGFCQLKEHLFDADVSPTKIPLIQLISSGLAKDVGHGQLKPKYRKVDLVEPII